VALRVIVADDSYLVREGIVRVLEGAPHIEVVAVVADRDSVMRAIDEEDPDVLVTDIRMLPQHNGEGVWVVSELRAARPQMGVLVLSQNAEPRSALDLLADGSEGRAYLLKERIHDRAQLTAAIEATASGGSIVDARVVEILATASARPASSPVAGLTAREREILAQIAQGKSNAAIAESLELTKRAIEKHINSILYKLDLPESEQTSRRVMAALLWLADEHAGLPDQSRTALARQR
jgi:DNA-binding NarL/FixJ family response regulator